MLKYELGSKIDELSRAQELGAGAQDDIENLQM